MEDVNNILKKAGIGGLVLVSGLVIGMILAVFIGLFIPERDFYSKRKSFNHPPTLIWEVLTDVKNYSRWKPGVTQIEVLGTDEMGNIEWREHYRSYSVEYVVDDKKAGEFLRYKASDVKSPTQETWILGLSVHEGKGILQVKRYTLTKGAFNKFIYRIVDKHAVDADAFFFALNRRLRELGQLRDSD